MARAKSWQARFIAGSLALHAALLGFAAKQHLAALAVPPRASVTSAELEIDEVVLDSPVAEPEPASAPTEPRAGAVARVASAGRHLEPVAEPPEEAVASAEVSEGPGEQPSAPVASSSAGPRLSLAQLGVGADNPFLDRGGPDKVRAARAAAAQRRLDRALAQGLHEADVRQGRGAQSPTIRALEAAVYASNAPLNGSASFVFVIDSSGTVLSATLGDATGDRTEWVRVARKAAEALAARRAALRSKGQGVRLTVAVTSHLELPSGADPGLEISAQGIPIKKGDGPRSTRLDVSLFPFPTAALGGDPADLGAHARRMVHAHVVSEELL